MTQALETVIRAARSLSQSDKFELLQVLSHDLQHDLFLAEENALFWSSPSLEELIDIQQPPIITDISALGADFWPEDETADDINAYIEQQRRTI